MKFEIYLVFILLVASAHLSLAECVQTTKTIYAPAVVSNVSSEMVQISIEALPGTGRVFASVSPSIGVDTQGSERTAAAIASKTAGVDDCDILLTIGAPSVSEVDGPSAGGAMTLLMLSALTGKELRSDFSMTGTIEDDGSIGPVGDVPLKAEAVARSGITLFLTPNLDSGDLMEILLLKKHYNLTVVQVGNVSTAFSIARSNVTPQENLVLTSENVSAYTNATVDHWYAPQLKDMAEYMVNSAESKVQSSDSAFKANFESRLSDAQSALKTNQLYTAANTAFLLSMDEDFANFTKGNAKNDYDSTNKCLSDFEAKNLTLQNFEVIGPAEARFSWAGLRMPTQASSDNGFIAPMLDEYYDVLYAKYWCAAADELNNYTYPGNETQFNSEVLRDYTYQVLNNISTESADMAGSNSDLDFHLNSAENSFDNGMYVAALVDAAYVQSYIDMTNISENDSNEALDRMLAENYTYIWPQVLRNHAAVIAHKDEGSGLMVALIAYDMNDYFDNVKSIASGGTVIPLVLNTGANTQTIVKTNPPIPMADWIFLAIGAVLVCWAYSMGKKAKHRRE